MRTTLGAAVLCVAAGFGQNWEVREILPGLSFLACAVATDAARSPRVAFGTASALGVAERDGSEWQCTYPDSGAPVASVDICVDSDSRAHVGFARSLWPAPDSVYYAVQDTGGWRVECVARGERLASTTLGPDGSPHVLFSCSSRVHLARKLGGTWRAWPVPAVSPDTLRFLCGFSCAVDSAGTVGIAVTWVKQCRQDDSLWMGFYQFDGTVWRQEMVDSCELWAAYDVFPCRVRYEPRDDRFRVAYCRPDYAAGRIGAWNVTRGLNLGEEMCGFDVGQGRAHLVCAYHLGTLEYQWQSGGSWPREDIGPFATEVNPSIAVDLDGRPHVAFAWNDAALGLGYARRLYVGVGETPPTVDPAAYEDRSLLASAERSPLSGDLRLRRSARLLDITGRQVGELAPGENDVSGLSPGVYFCRPTAGSASSTRKVVIQR